MCLVETIKTNKYRKAVNRSVQKAIFKKKKKIHTAIHNQHIAAVSFKNYEK